MSMNIELARKNMIHSQVKTWNISDERVLDTLGRVHRENFVAPQYRNHAFSDVPLPIGHGEYMMKPVIEGRMLQALDLLPTDRVLEIGTGSGFITACLATLAGHVTSVELHADLADTARQRLAGVGIANAEIHVGEAVHDWSPKERFDAVVVTGGVHVLPARFRDWVADHGRLFAIVGVSPAMTAVLYQRDNAGWHEQSLLDTDIAYLQHAAPPAQFTL